MLIAGWRVRIERCCSPLSGNAARASGPPGRGSKRRDAQDGILIVMAAMAYVSKARRRIGT
eukprot:4440737-Prymnesium_polylepis.1